MRIKAVSSPEKDLTLEQIPEYGMTAKDAAAELLRRRRMRESIIGFSQNITIPMVPRDDEIDADENLLKPIGWGMVQHHVLLMNKLQKCMTTPYGRLMVFMPPGSAKSTYCDVVAPAWYMGNNPESQIILCSYNTSLAKKHGGRCRNVVQQDNYRSAFQTTIDPSTTAKEMWKLQNGSEYMSSGLTSGITGNRAWGAILDDPIRGRADAESPTILQKTISAYEDDLSTRFIPGAWIVVMQTRWTYNDIPGKILGDEYDYGSGIYEGTDGMEWEVLNLPAKHEWPEIQDPLGRQVGEYLWPEWFDKKHWKQYEHIPENPKSPPARRWYSLFQQRPRPDTGNQWEKDWTQWYTLGEHPKWLMLFSSSDYAVAPPEEGQDPDWTEHGIAGLDEEGGLWFVDWWYGRATTDITIPALINMAKKWRVRNGFGESGIIRRAIEAQFLYYQRKLKWRMNIEYLSPISKKVAKFQAFRGLGAAGLVHIPDCPWGQRLAEHLYNFPDRGPDDAPDVCSHFGRGTEHMVWSKERCQKPPDKGLVFGSWDWLCTGTEEEEKYPY